MATIVQHILDTHIHLFGGSGSGFGLNASMGAYNDAIAMARLPNYQFDGFMYVETDQTIRPGKPIEQWAAGKLDELAFLRRIVESKPQSGEHFTAADSTLLKGIVPWVPINRGVDTFREYLKIAEQTAGNKTWSKVKGFRYLLQDISNINQFKALVEDPQATEVLKAFGDSYTFDAGVDSKFGVWQLQETAGLIEKVSSSSKTRFVISESRSLF